MIRPQSLFGPLEKPSTIDSPLDHLMACHRRIEDRLATMERAAAHLDDRREEAVTAFENAFRFMESSGALHTADEEESLFPRLAGLVQTDERAYLDGLERDHAEAERIYAELKAAVAAARSGGVSREAVEELAGRLAALYTPAHRIRGPGAPGLCETAPYPGAPGLHRRGDEETARRVTGVTDPAPAGALP